MPFKDPQKAKEYAREYAKKNRARINENSNKPKRKEKRKQYLQEYNSNPEKVELAKKRKDRYYEKNKDKIRTRDKNLYLKNKDLVNEVKKFYGCMNLNCKWEKPCDLVILEFHHYDPKTKKACVMQLLHNSCVLIAKEINKCVLLCCNCHRLAHVNLIEIVDLCSVDENLLVKIGDFENVNLEGDG